MAILCRPSVIELFIRFSSFIFSLFPLPAKLNQNATMLIICCQPIALNFAIWSFLVKSCCCEGFISCLRSFVSQTFLENNNLTERRPPLTKTTSDVSVVKVFFIVFDHKSNICGTSQSFLRQGKLLLIFAGTFQGFSTLR